MPTIEKAREKVDDLELILLEAQFADELKCRVATHYGVARIPVACSIKAVALVSTSCRPGITLPVCQSLLDVYTWGFTKRVPCAGCGLLVKNCWTIRPL